LLESLVKRFDGSCPAWSVISGGRRRGHGG